MTPKHSNFIKVFTNDIVIFDISKFKIIDLILPNAFFFPARIHHKGFRINNYIYSYGGITEKGIILHDFVEINLDLKKCNDVNLTSGDQLPPVYGHAVASVFYQ